MRKPTSKKPAPGSAKELLRFEHFQLKIKADTNGLKVFAEAHVRHKQEGPDVLIISTPDHNLNFKTTFAPGPGAGQNLRCIIAGVVTVLPAMDFTPKDWRAFTDKLTMRNTRIMKKTPIEKIETRTKKSIDKILKAQRTASERARLEYEKSSDPQVVINFIKRSSWGAAAFDESWVRETIQKWIRSDRHDLLKSSFLRGRGRPSAAKAKIKSMLFVERIEKSRRTGKSLNEALISEAERTGGGDLTGDDLKKELTALRNMYNRAKRTKTEVTVQETAESFVMTAFPAKITKGDFAAFGEWKISFPKK